MYQWLPLVFVLGWLVVLAQISAQASEGWAAEPPPQGSDQLPMGNQSADLADVMWHLIHRTNVLRQQEDRPALMINPQLTASAQDFATVLARTGQLSHTADGQTPEARAQAHGYDACLIAENIASQHHPTGSTAETLAEGFFQSWQHSPSHRENLLAPAVMETGVAVAQSERIGTYYAVQLFGRPRSQQIEFQIANASDLAIPYTINGQTVSLAAQATHTHQQCQPPAVTFHWPGRQEQTMVYPNHWEHHTIVRGDDGAFRVERGYADP